MECGIVNEGAIVKSKLLVVQGRGFGNGDSGGGLSLGKIFNSFGRGKCGKRLKFCVVNITVYITQSLVLDLLTFFGKVRTSTFNEPMLMAAVDTPVTEALASKVLNRIAGTVAFNFNCYIMQCDKVKNGFVDQIVFQRNQVDWKFLNFNAKLSNMDYFVHLEG